MSYKHDEVVHPIFQVLNKYPATMAEWSVFVLNDYGVELRFESDDARLPRLKLLIPSPSAPVDPALVLVSIDRLRVEVRCLDLADALIQHAEAIKARDAETLFTSVADNLKVLIDSE